MNLVIYDLIKCGDRIVVNVKFGFVRGIFLIFLDINFGRFCFLIFNYVIVILEIRYFKELYLKIKLRLNKILYYLNECEVLWFLKLFWCNLV